MTIDDDDTTTAKKVIHDYHGIAHHLQSYSDVTEAQKAELKRIQHEHGLSLQDFDYVTAIARRVLP
jgi:hypothetical protein